MNWNIDEAHYPGPREGPDPLVVKPSRMYIQEFPPESAQSGDIWINASANKTYTKFSDDFWLETK